MTLSKIKKIIEKLRIYPLPKKLDIDIFIMRYINHCTYIGISQLKDSILMIPFILLLLSFFTKFILKAEKEVTLKIVEISLYGLLITAFILSHVRYMKKMEKKYKKRKTKSVDVVIEKAFRVLLRYYKLNSKKKIERCISSLERKKTKVKGIYGKFVGSILFLFYALNITELTSISKILSTNEETAYIAKSMFFMLVFGVILYLACYWLTQEVLPSTLFYKTAQIDHLIDRLTEEQDKFD